MASQNVEAFHLEHDFYLKQDPVNDMVSNVEDIYKNMFEVSGKMSDIYIDIIEYVSSPEILPFEFAVTDTKSTAEELVMSTHLMYKNYHDFIKCVKYQVSDMKDLVKLMDLIDSVKENMEKLKMKMHIYFQHFVSAKFSEFVEVTDNSKSVMTKLQTYLYFTQLLVDNP